MVQQIQPKPITTKPVAKSIVKPGVVTKPGVQPIESGSIWSKWWIWVIIAVVVIGIGVGIYALL